MPKTLVILKPDAVRRGIFPKLIDELHDYADFERMELRTLTIEEVKNLYKKYVNKAPWHRISTFMTSGPSVVLVLNSENYTTAKIFVERIRQVCLGLRKDFFDFDDPNQAANVIHSSSSPTAAKREIGIFYEPSNK